MCWYRWHVPYGWICKKNTEGDSSWYIQDLLLFPSKFLTKSRHLPLQICFSVFDIHWGEFFQVKGSFSSYAQLWQIVDILWLALHIDPTGSVGFFSLGSWILPDWKNALDLQWMWLFFLLTSWKFDLAGSMWVLLLFCFSWFVKEGSNNILGGKFYLNDKNSKLSVTESR